MRGPEVRKSRAEMKAELMKQAEAIIDELIEWQAETEQPNFNQVEEKVLALRQKLSEEMTRVTVEGQAAVRPVPGPACPDCQREMRYKGMKDNTVSSWVGDVTFERGYYYCDHCRGGLFPPGPTT
jgi:predicted RNA-binding protein